MPLRKYIITPFCILMSLLMSQQGYAQRYDTASVFDLPLTLDTFVVKSGFDVNAFIRRVRTDTTFYKAFRSMHLMSNDAVNDITAYDKKGRVAATYHSKTRQEVAGNCRTMQVTYKQVTGDFYKRNGDYSYYTAELFAYLFFINGKACNEDDIVGNKMNEYGKGQMERRKYELKQLIFNPGSRISGIPFMSDRASIFDHGEAEKYDMSIRLEEHDGQPCYVFRIVPKKGYEQDVIYDELTTWFRKGDYSILARDYALSYHTLLYDLDVKMKVRTTQIGDKIYPTYIAYDGNWHVVTQGRERVKFAVSITY